MPKQKLVVAPKIDRNTREFSNGVDLHLVLKYSAAEMRQRDVERFMAALRDQQLDIGNSPVETNGALFRAAIACSWVVEPAIKNGDEVGDLPPALVAWYAHQIDFVYSESLKIPLA